MVANRFHNMRWLACWLGVASGALMAVSAAQAQDYPNRTIKIIVPNPPGGTADGMPRIIADWLSRKWGQAVIIENKTGAAGNIGAEAAYKSDPDGYTLLSSPPTTLAINVSLYPKLNYNPAEFVPIIVMGRVPNALVVNPTKIKANSVPEFIAAAQANPGKITYASAGAGSTQHLTAEMFQMMAKVKMQHVPYRGTGPALTDLLGGSVDVMFDNLGFSLPLVQQGKLKLIAVATPTRMTALPNVPTIAETLPGFESAAWFAIVAPPKTPQEIANKINAAINEALRDPQIRQRFDALSAEVVGGPPEAAAAFMRAETERWRKVIAAANVKLN